MTLDDEQPAEQQGMRAPCRPSVRKTPRREHRESRFTPVRARDAPGTSRALPSNSLSWECLVTTDIPLITIAADCPESDCDWVSCNRHLEQVVFAHLVEKHGYLDTTAHVLAYEAATPTVQ